MQARPASTTNYQKDHHQESSVNSEISSFSFIGGRSFKPKVAAPVSISNKFDYSQRVDSQPSIQAKTSLFVAKIDEDLLKKEMENITESV
jgi:hypothetical protein